MDTEYAPLPLHNTSHSTKLYVVIVCVIAVKYNSVFKMFIYEYWRRYTCIYTFFKLHSCMLIDKQFTHAN